MGFLRERFRFTLWPTLFTIPAVLFMLALGNWQVERLAWKTALIDAGTAAMAAPPVPLPETLAAAGPLDFHHVKAAGSFDHSKELYIIGYDKRGIEGFQIVTPLILADGRALLVNRGFVPDSRKDPATRAEGEVAGPVEVDGVLRVPKEPTGLFSSMVPRNQPGDNIWVYVDVPAMAATVKLDHVLPFYIEADATPNPGGFPIGGQTRITLPNDHLQYAITWYLLALIFTVGYFVYHYKKPEETAP